MKLAAPLLTCDPVNPWHGKRKGGKKTKEKERKKGLCERSGGAGKEKPFVSLRSGSGGGRKTPFGSAACGRNGGGTEATITQETFLLSSLGSFLAARIKRQQCEKEKKKKKKEVMLL